MSLLWALLCGLLFGAGLIVSDMINPERVLGFLDVAGDWDPSLGFVMGGAVLVTFVGYRWVLRRKSPLFSAEFHIPLNRQIDRRLLSGAATFGIGWGMVGLCPGPALTAVSAALIGQAPGYVLLFFAAMLAGFYVARAVSSRSAA